MGKELVKIDLKNELDKIDEKIFTGVEENYYVGKRNVYIGMWEKGEKIVEYRGVDSTISFYKLEKISGRSQESIKEWHNLCEKYPDKKKYIKEYAEPKAREWARKALDKLLNKSTSSIDAPELPDGIFNVIYADPPWQYNDKQNTVVLGGAEKHYPTMAIDEICALPVADICADNSVLFIWVTSPLLEDVFKVINSWGFKYKTSFVWDKIKHNMGHYNSVRHEFLLIAVRGSYIPDNIKLFDSVQSIEKFDSVQSIEKKEHSRKPNKFYEIIETLYDGKKIELFARNKRPGWKSWGLEINKYNKKNK